LAAQGALGQHNGSIYRKATIMDVDSKNRHEKQNERDNEWNCWHAISVMVSHFFVPLAKSVKFGGADDPRQGWL